MLKRLRNLLGRRSTPSSSDGAAPSRKSRRTEIEERPPVHRGPKIVHRPIPISDIDPDAVKIVRRLTRFDHTAYLVGGCVRDLLLDRRPKDFDIGTTATPRQVRRLFGNCRIIGRRFRLAHIYFQKGKIIEVATFRARNGDEEADPGKEASRGLLVRDDNIFGTPEEDALRRDFTINALFYDLNDETILDHADGLGDLRRRLIHTIGDPEIRFREDPIRILRAVKFAGRLDFSIETSTLEAIERTRSLIPKAAPPRVLEEINRLCRGGAARRSFELLRQTGVFEVILPEIAKAYHEDPNAWSLALEFLGVVDKRFHGGREVSTGEIFAMLLLPILARPMGWQPGGVVQRRKGIRVNDLANDALRPMATHLRVSRKDQETCRQILGTLYRMVPAGGIRRSTRQSILQRPATSHCLWILQALADRSGGEFARAFDYWRRAVRDSPEVKPAAKGPTRPGRRAADASPAGRSRRRRRSSRRSDAQAAPRPSASDTGKPDRGKVEAMPPPWDDGYFFAALPTVPAPTADENKDAGRGRERTAADPSEGSAATSGAGTAKRRRRRRKRKPRPSGSGSGEAT